MTDRLPMDSHSINTGDAIFDIILGQMGSLCLRTTLLERMAYDGDGMGVGLFYLKEVA